MYFPLLYMKFVVSLLVPEGWWWQKAKSTHHIYHRYLMEARGLRGAASSASWTQARQGKGELRFCDGRGIGEGERLINDKHAPNGIMCVCLKGRVGDLGAYRRRTWQRYGVSQVTSHTPCTYSPTLDQPALHTPCVCTHTRIHMYILKTGPV